MLPLSTSELVQMRGVADVALPGTAVIHTATKASDSQGGYTWTYAAASTVDARLAFENLRGGEAITAGRLAELGNWILTVPAHTTLDEDDRVVFDTVTYEVTEVLTWVPWEISRRARLREVD